MRRVLTMLAGMVVLALVLAAFGAATTSNALSGSGKFSDYHASFNVKTLPDGTVDGTGVFRFLAYERTFEVTFNCFVVNGTTAYASGLIVSPASSAGQSVSFAVRDNGEGVGAPQDQMARLSWGSPCTNADYQRWQNEYFDAGLGQVNSNIQVR